MTQKSMANKTALLLYPKTLIQDIVELQYCKLSGVQSREESPPGDLFVCQQMIWQPCNTKCGNPVDRTVSKLLPFDFPCPKT